MYEVPSIMNQVRSTGKLIKIGFGVFLSLISILSFLIFCVSSPVSQNPRISDPKSKI